MRKRAALFNPYFDTEGGGERYCLGVIWAWQQLGYQVDVFWLDTALMHKLEQRFGLTLEAVMVDVRAYKTVAASGKWWEKYQLEKVYDRLFFVSDGSVPLMMGKKNVLHFQVPFLNVSGKSLGNALKFRRIQTVVCNSEFTQKVIEKEYGIDSDVIYPPVNMIQPLQKKKLILSVGRFDSILHNKRQDILLKAFKQLNEPSWQLVLAGGSKDQGARAEELRAMAKGSPVTIVVNPSWDELQRLYGQAQIYWHAAGYGEDLLTQPEKAEHFGITTAEAMSAGAVPVVFAGGGQLEIVTESCGRVWSETAELVSITRTLIASNNSRRVLAEQAMERAKDFSQEKFDYAVKTIIG